MDLVNLSEDRFLKKSPSQTDQTKGVVYTASNPAPKKGDDGTTKTGQAKNSTEDDGAPNILTGTVIISCFIQTSALPSRIELQGNDLTFFDDTYAQNGQVIGDTSRLIFTNGSAKKGGVITQGFIMEKRASGFNTYDNVISWYALDAGPGLHNYMFIGRDGYGGDQKRHLNSLHFAINKESDFIVLPGNPLNGVLRVEYSIDGVFKNQIFAIGNTTEIFPDVGLAGYSTAMIAGEGGFAGLGYVTAAGSTVAVLYILSENAIGMGASIIPDTASAYDLGSASFPVRNIYASGAIGIGGGGITWTSGTGSPETVVTAPIGSLYSNKSGGATTTLYVKTSGSGNTGWTAK